MNSFFFSFNFLLISIFALPLSMCSKDDDSENLDDGIDIEMPVIEDEIAEIEVHIANNNGRVVHFQSTELSPVSLSDRNFQYCHC